MLAFLTADAMDAWLERIKLDRGGREDLLATWTARLKQRPRPFASTSSTGG